MEKEIGQDNQPTETRSHGEKSTGSLPRSGPAAGNIGLIKSGRFSVSARTSASVRPLRISDCPLTAPWTVCHKTSGSSACRAG